MPMIPPPLLMSGTGPGSLMSPMSHLMSSQGTSSSTQPWGSAQAFQQQGFPQTSASYPYMYGYRYPYDNRYFYPLPT